MKGNYHRFDTLLPEVSSLHCAGRRGRLSSGYWLNGQEHMGLDNIASMDALVELARQIDLEVGSGQHRRRLQQWCEVVI